ncbi:MAG: OmpA family protein [Rhodospirillaceae bacterium]|nr:OmpA family protein [Rhodospirillaceae bacterium]
MNERIKRNKEDFIPAHRRYGRAVLTATLLLSLTGITACSAVPDAINPTQWYQNTVDFFAGEDTAGQVAEQQPQAEEMKKNPGEGQAFPNLASVPERPVQPVAGGLVADTENRQYETPIARQGESVSSLATNQPALSQPAPPAMPVAPTPVQPSVESIAPMPSSLTPLPTEMAALSPPSGMPELPANAITSMDADPFATVVVSSSGVEMASAPVVRAATQSGPAPTNVSSLAESLQRPDSNMSSGTKIATILFKNGSANIDARDRQILGEVARLHRKNGGTIRIVGHASSRTRNMDPVSHKMVNYSVSMERADIIAGRLIALGVPAEKVAVDARSDSQPLYYEIMPSGETGNRRAEIYFE